MGDVIDLRPDELLSLPECPTRACSRCGREDYTRWCSKDLGCSECAPENEQASTELSVMSSRIFLLESALKNIHRAAVRDGRVLLAEINGILRNHMFKVEGDEVVQLAPPEPPPQAVFDGCHVSTFTMDELMKTAAELLAPDSPSKE